MIDTKTSTEQATEVANLPIVPQATETPRVPLDDMAQDLADLDMCERMINDWEERAKVIKNRIKNRIGPRGIGTFKGVDVWAHSPTDRFANARFAKENPEIAAQFTHAKVEQVLNLEELKRAMPDLYGQYQVSSLRPMGSKK